MLSTSENLAGSPDITKLEKLCQRYDAECMALEAGVAALEADLEAVKQRHLAKLKRQAAVVARAEAELASAVEQAPQLFKRPRTLVLHGTKIGFANTIGSVVFEDGDYVVKAVRNVMPERFDEFVKTEFTPRKDALRKLTPDELDVLACRVEGDGEVVVLKRVAGDVEKLMDKLISKLVTAMAEAEGV